MNGVYVAGVGLTKVGDHWSRSILDLAVEAGRKALIDSGNIRPSHVVVGNMFSGASSRQEHTAALLAHALGLKHAATFKVESACSSGGAAIHSACSLVGSGLADAVLVVGVEKMRDLEADEVSAALCMAENFEYTQFFGASFVALNALLARKYMHEFGVKRDELAAFPVLAHKNAASVEHAQFRRPIEIEDIVRSQMISDPLRMLDCAPVGDGAAAAVIVNKESINQPPKNHPEIVASSLSTNDFSLYEREDMLSFDATKTAFNDALKQASLTRGEINMLEVHDAFSVVAAMSLEAMGFSKRGEAPLDATEGLYNLDGKLPVCTFGGLKARGHPVGASGVYQLVEAVWQLRRSAGKNQIPNAQVAAIQNVGGVDTTAAVHILQRN